MTEITKEQLAQMSPEQIAEMQKQQCIFCQIISGKVASKKVYEDEKCLAILDINPANPGHILILPKEHHAIMPLMPAEEVAHLSRITKKISAAQIRGLKAEGTNIFMANGAAAGQKAPHFMIHSIPRKSGDGITSFSIPKNQITAEDLKKLQAAIRGKVNEQSGIEQEEPVNADKPEPQKVRTEVAEQEEAPESEPGNAPEAHQNGDGQDSPMFHIPPPEESEQEDKEKKSKEEEGKPDLDTISNMFK